jgi:hypothetical protein
VTANGTSNVGGVCQITADFKTGGAVTKIQADAEVPIAESKIVPVDWDVNVYGRLLFPGCHFVFYDTTGQVIKQIDTAKDSPLKVCFGANPELKMSIWYYLDTPVADRQWVQIASHLDETGKLICADNAIYTGVYMSMGLLVPPPGTGEAGVNPFFPNGWGGTVQTPASFVTITGNGTYAVGGLCLITTQYFVSGLKDTVQVEERPEFTQNTKTVPSDALNGDMFYFPGCHVVHYKDNVIKDQMNTTTPKDGDWQICFAAIPGKTETIYYYMDDTSTVAPPWTKLDTTTANGMACADLVDFSAVYAPAAH